MSRLFNRTKQEPGRVLSEVDDLPESLRTAIEEALS